MIQWSTVDNSHSFYKRLPHLNEIGTLPISLIGSVPIIPPIIPYYSSSNITIELLEK